MSEPELVSVVMIFLDEERFMGEAIASVLAQTHPHWELVLVDDGSTDGSSRQARAAAAGSAGRITYVEHPGHGNRGMSASRNTGIAASRGGLVAFLDADDRWLPTRLERTVAAFRGPATPSVVVSPARWWYSWTGSAADQGRDFDQRLLTGPGGVVDGRDLLAAFIRDEWASWCDVTVRRDAIEAVGGYEEVFSGMYEDQAFHAKLCVHGPVRVVDDVSYLYRQHADACTATSHAAGAWRGQRREFLRWLERYLDEQDVTDAVLLGLVRAHLLEVRPDLVGTARRVARRLMWRAP